ncbi:hypothetical protein D1B31_22085 [Neobacillus notoginsengisoli]|uniref:Uncharacterized protein n=1 Tax=Neobacillus notoginsengisoli TaxID=1578198 RepID=A0A417YFH8_9BACI|nr:hypothetical protein [Neobacillus notoginsengisoli]RHW31498.1 hypothetical protein D1B31_22085 [Neobacillus notoginsengisoli]
MFEAPLLIAAGGILVTALTDSLADSLGYHWLGTVVKIALPIAGFAAGIYFLEFNPMLRWLP